MEVEDLCVQHTHQPSDDIIRNEHMSETIFFPPKQAPRTFKNAEDSKGKHMPDGYLTNQS